MRQKKHKDLLKNFSYIYILQATNILIPLILLPYLVRKLGVEKFGLISFAQVIAAYFIVFIDFGFNLSIVKLISTNSDSKKKLSEIVSSVLIIKTVFILVSFIFLLIAVSAVDKLQENKLLYLYMFGYVVGVGLLPTWFFQGIQQMKYITIINFFVKIVFLLLIIYYVRTPNDYLNYPALLSIANLLVLPFTYFLVIKKYKVILFLPHLTTILYYLKYSSHYFLSRLSIRLYENGGLFVLGLVSTDLLVGYYAIADKFRKAILMLFSPVNQALYPFMSKEKDISLYKKIFTLINILNVIGVSILLLFTEELYQLIFGEYVELSVEVTKILIFAILLEIPSILIGFPLLGAFGHSNFVNYSLVATALIYLTVLFITYYFDLISVKSVAYLYAFSIVIELSIRVAGVIKYQPWKANV